jgi:predicted transcriptional regulator of viral defense system
MNAKVGSTSELVRNWAEAITLGEPFSSAELLALGTRAAIDHSLSRLTKAGVITRLTRGVYVRSITNEYVGQVTPEPFKIAQAVARGTGAQISMNGAEAARRFELSTQMSTQSLFLTTGRTRQIIIGKSKIRLQHTSSRKLALAGRPAGMALSALYYLGREEVTTSVIEKIKAKLAPAEFEQLRRSTELMPSWMSDVFYQNESAQTQEPLVA